MDSLKLAALMYIAAGILFVVTSIFGGNFLTLPVGAVLLLLGLKKLRQGRDDENQNQDEAW